MGIADLFRPKHRHSDVRVRTEAVKAMGADDAAILIQVARTDRDIGVRRLAIEKIDEASTLADIAADETERSLREFAGERAAQLYASTACGDDEDDASNALEGIIKLGDQHALVEVAVNAALATIRKRAFGELRDPKALAELAKGDAPQDLRLAAVGRIDDGDVLRAIAIDTTLKEVGLAAVDKLDDVDRLENVAQKAKNKGVRQRARKVVQEMAEAERAKKTPATPDEVKRRRAEKAQLIREVEGFEGSFEFEKNTPVVKAAEEAFGKLPADDGDERFTKAVERFWKRKSIYDQQARSADELRAVEREAAAAKERAAAERAAADIEAKIPDDIETKPEPVADAARAAREAEAAARREERAARKAEEDARRAEEQAAREAKRKDDAERGAALATSLAAMLDDMEKLAADGSKDGRTIDRLLQQAGRAFEQIGKVASDQRDALSDRYTAARGKLVVRASELREAEDWQRFANVPKAEALIATAKGMLTEEPSQDLGNRLRQMQALWKEVGPMPQRRSKELWEQFKQLCDAIYDKVKGFRAVENEKFADVAKAKEALIAEAEALADSTDWQQTANALKALQARWKESGHLPRKQGDELWKRFRAACDRFFERRKPQLDAEHAEQVENLTKKQALIERAKALTDAAPGEGGWGKAIAEIKKLQLQWKEIGFVPRRDADAIYKAFRAACDALFAKRDAARDAEANEHHAAIDDIKGEIADVLSADEADVIAKALAVRTKARELDSRDLAQRIEQMVRHVVTAHPEKVKGTELDPAALKTRRDKLIAKVEELLPKSAPAVTAESNPADIAAQLKQAMRSNAFGDLRFSGRDPVEVVDELRLQWIEAGPLLDEADQAQAAKFEDAVKRVLDAAGAAARADESASRDARGDRDRGERNERGERGERRRRRERDRDRDRDRDGRAPGAPDEVASSERKTVESKPLRKPDEADARVLAGAPSLDSEPIPYPRSVHEAATVPVAAARIPKSVEDVKTAPGGWAPTTPVSPAVAPATPEPAPAPAPVAAKPVSPSVIPAIPKIPSIPSIPSPPKAVEKPAEAKSAEPAAAAIVAAIPHVTHDAITAPATYPFEPLPPPPVPATAPAASEESARAKPTTVLPPMDDLDDGWDMGDDDPTAASEAASAAAAADAAMERPEPDQPPSSSEMAGDGAAGGDGIDEPGWD